MDAIQESLNQMMVTFGQRMDSFEDRQGRQTSNPGTPTPEDDSLALEFQSFKMFVITSLKSLQGQIEVMAKQLDQQEMRGRRKYLLLHGLNEVQNEHTEACLVKVLSDHFKLSGLNSGAITQCHRLGRASSNDKSRPILFKLRDLDLRSSIWSSKSSLKGTGLIISEFLTKSRQDLFMAARQKYGIRQSWTRDGSIFVAELDGRRRRIECIADLAGASDCVVSHKDTLKPVAPTKQTVKAPTAKTRRAAASKK